MEQRIRPLEGRAESQPGSEIAKGSLGLYLVNKGIDSEGEEYLKQAIDSEKNIASYPSILNLAAYYARFKNQSEKSPGITNPI